MFHSTVWFLPRIQQLHYLEVAIQFPFATGPKGRPRGYVEIELDKVYFELYMCIMEANKKGDFESSSHLLEWLKHCVQLVCFSSLCVVYDVLSDENSMLMICLCMP